MWLCSSINLAEKALAAKGFKVEDEDIYLYKSSGVQTVWPYDDRGARKRPRERVPPELPHQVSTAWFKAKPHDGTWRHEALAMGLSSGLSSTT